MSCGKISFVGAALLLGLVITWTGETKAANAAFGICDPYARQLAMLGISDPRPFDDEPGAVSLLEVAAQNFASGRRQEGEDALLQAANYVSGFDVNLIAEITRNIVAVMHSLGLGGYDREFVERVYLSMKPLAVDRSTYHWSPIYWALGVLEILRDIDPDAAVARVREMPAIIEAAEVCEVEKAFPYFYILQRAGAWLTEGERDRMFDQLETGVSVMPALDHYGFSVKKSFGCS